MDMRVRDCFRSIVKDLPEIPKKVLELAPPKNPEKSLLCIPELENADACGINLTGPFDLKGKPVHHGNSNKMDIFSDTSFDLILSNALLEHDAYFWKTLEECRRLLKSGGILIIGVPGFAPNKRKEGNSTSTFRYHMQEDYYRFSPLAVEKVFLQDFVDISVRTILKPPRIVGSGRKP